MHRTTELRWMRFFLLLTGSAFTMQCIGCSLHGWLRLYFIQSRSRTFCNSTNLNNNYNNNNNISMDPLDRIHNTIYQDYGIWYMTECSWSKVACMTLSYDYIQFLLNSELLDETLAWMKPTENNNLFDMFHESKIEYIFGMIFALCALLIVWNQYKSVMKNKMTTPPRVKWLVCVIASLLSGVLILVPTCRFFMLESQFRQSSEVTVSFLTGSYFALSGGAVPFLAAVTVALRLLFRDRCPDCVDSQTSTNVVARDTLIRAETVDGTVPTHNM